MDRPIPPQLSLPSYISWLPPLIRFLASALQYQQASQAYMDELEAEATELRARVAELDAIPVPPALPAIEPPPQITVVEKPVAPWMDAVLAPFTTNIDTDFMGMRRAMLTYSYRVVSKTDFLKIVDYWRQTTQPIWWQSFKVEGWDDVCDWWSWAFRGWCLTTFQIDSVGFVVDNGDHHSYNFIPYEDGTWELFDPQYNSFAVVGTTGLAFKTGILVM